MKVRTSSLQPGREALEGKEDRAPLSGGQRSGLASPSARAAPPQQRRSPRDLHLPERLIRMFGKYSKWLTQVSGEM